VGETAEDRQIKALTREELEHALRGAQAVVARFDAEARRFELTIKSLRARLKNALNERDLLRAERGMPVEPRQDPSGPLADLEEIEDEEEVLSGA
jgi:hypothetical protein